MLEFKPFSITALKEVLPYIKKTSTLCSELSAGSLFMWQEGTDLAFCVHNDTFVMRQTIGEQPAFTWPVGEDVYDMVNELYDYAKSCHTALRFYEIDDNTLEVIKNDERLSCAMYAYEERWSDYIYSFADVLTFKGNKYKGQRNHINKFKRLYGEPVIRFINDDDHDAIIDMLSEYAVAHNDASEFEKSELEKTRELLDIYRELDLFAACLTVNGEIAAFSIGEIIGDTLLIHIEKALTRYDGIYPTMYQGFTKLIYEHTGKMLGFVNREDDSGDEGLRISKMQYHPVGRINKYLVHINSPAYILRKIPVINAADIVFTEFKEKDKHTYFELNTDVDNNKFWGYDYREDEDIIGTIDDNTFYDFTMLDIKAGDSVNFAIRRSVDGEMIGEAILWNFTADGFAEVGCRLMPDYQGNRFGNQAFGALSDFAEQVLKVNVSARCFKENKKSYRMITANGYKQVREDDKYYYFSRV